MGGRLERKSGFRGAVPWGRGQSLWALVNRSRDTQEPITGPRGRAAARWVRRAAGRSCLRGPGAHVRRWRSGSADERGRGRGSAQLDRRSRCRSRRVVPAAAPGSPRATASRAAPAPASRGQHGGRGGPGERSPGARSAERGACEAAPPLPASSAPADRAPVAVAGLRVGMGVRGG